MSYQNTGKPNGRPSKNERNQQIIADFMAGVPIKDVAEKFCLALPYTRQIASEHIRKDRIKRAAENPISAGTGLYYQRDIQLMGFYNTLNAKGSLSKYHVLDNQVEKKEAVA